MTDIVPNTNKEEQELKISSFEKELQQISERNKRVEADKAWEVSKFRICTIVFITYLLTCLVFYILNVQKFYLNAIIPTLGYYLSTQSLPFVKRFWLRNIYNRSS